MSRFWSPFVHTLSPYMPGEQPKIKDLVKLNTNEFPFAPSPQVLAAITGATDAALRLYPDPDSQAVKHAIARFYDIQPEQVFVGNGSDEILAHTFNAFFKRDLPLLFPDITYSFYPTYCKLYDIDYQVVHLDQHYAIRLDDYQQPNGGVIFPNPNAPTGHFTPLEQIQQLLERNRDSVVVVDEAYIDFGGESAVALLKHYPNLLVIQTASKSRALAGMRIGWALGSAELIAGLVRVKDSFNSYPADRLAQVAAVAAFEDVEYFTHTCQQVIALREDLTQHLADFGLEVLPSKTNFVFARHTEMDAQHLCDQLRERGILVRHFKNPERIRQFLRITVGTAQQQQQLYQALSQILQQYCQTGE